MMKMFLSYVLFCLCAVAHVFGGIDRKTIDVVYLWVDGSDPEWQQIKQEYSSALNGPKMRPDANAKNRYSDHDELKYSLRSVWKYAPFVNHIYIVTMNQRPEWLADHPQITIVDHKDIFKNPNDLPTFNSMAIESNLHRIPGLSEYFIYFNDDMFLGNSVSESDFFAENGKVKVSFDKKRTSPDGSASKNEITFLSACRNTNNLLNQCYGRKNRHFVSHAPYALSKSYMEESAERFADVFDATSSHKFRCAQDYTITNGLLQYHWNYQGRVEKSELTRTTVYLYSDKDLKVLIKDLKKVNRCRPQTFCLQDKIAGPDKKVQEALHSFFEALYPQPAPWEKPL